MIGYGIGLSTVPFQWCSEDLAYWTLCGLSRPWLPTTRHYIWSFSISKNVTCAYPWLMNYGLHIKEQQWATSVTDLCYPCRRWNNYLTFGHQIKFKECHMFPHWLSLPQRCPPFTPPVGKYNLEGTTLILLLTVSSKGLKLNGLLSFINWNYSCTIGPKDAWWNVSFTRKPPYVLILKKPCPDNLAAEAWSCWMASSGMLIGYGWKQKWKRAFKIPMF